MNYADLQITINDRTYSFDMVFDAAATQDVVYELCAAPLIDKLFKGEICDIYCRIELSW